LKHLIELITELEERKVGFKSLTESIDTNTSGGKLIFTFSALLLNLSATYQRKNQCGLSAARARGRKVEATGVR